MNIHSTIRVYLRVHQFIRGFESHFACGHEATRSCRLVRRKHADFQPMRIQDSVDSSIWWQFLCLLDWFKGESTGQPPIIKYGRDM